MGGSEAPHQRQRVTVSISRLPVRAVPLQATPRTFDSAKIHFFLNYKQNNK